MNKISSIALSFFITLSLLSTSCDSSDDSTPDVAGPTIAITLPADSVEYLTGAEIKLTADLTSGSNLTQLTATVSYKSDLKSTVMPWNPEATVITLEGKTTQALKAVTLFSTIPANAKAGIYHLVIDVSDSGNKTARKEVPFLIVN